MPEALIPVTAQSGIGLTHRAQIGDMLETPLSRERHPRWPKYCMQSYPFASSVLHTEQFLIMLPLRAKHADKGACNASAVTMAQARRANLHL